jgi:GT2 family glycosyltransferase
MRISVIIVAYINSDVLIRTLKSIEKYNDIGSDLEVIVVDNSPKNKRVDSAITEQKCKFDKYIPADNSGFGAGNNLGASVASGDVLAFLNPDIILIQPVFSLINRRFESDKNLALLGGKLLYENLTPAFSFYYDYKASILSKWMIKLWNKLNHYNPHNMYIAGADLIIRKEIFESIGRFDENIFMYYEEPDLIRRIKRIQSAKIVFDKSIRMIHLERKGSPISPKMVEYEINSAVYYGRKYGLDYEKKINADYRYLTVKSMFFSILNSPKRKALIDTLKVYRKKLGEM